MDLDFIIFPAPKQTEQDHPQAQVLWIPKYHNLYPDFKDYIPRKNKKLGIFFVHQSEDFEDEHLIASIDEAQEFSLQPVPHFKWVPSNKNKKQESPKRDDQSSPVFDNEPSPETLASKVISLNLQSVKSKKTQQQQYDFIKQEESQIYLRCHSPKLSKSQPLIELPEEIQQSTQKKKRRNSQQKKDRGVSFGHIPCMYIDSGQRSPQIIIYFHGNAENINLSYPFLIHLRNNFQVSVIAVEYPGYGLYRNSTPNAESILNDAEYVYNYLTKRLGYDERNIIIFGRSIGSGPATYLASKYSPGCLALMSPFTSLKAVVRDYIGSWASVLVKQRFDNLQNIKNVTSPIFILHGLDDDLIPCKQAQELSNSNPRATLHLAEGMDHINYKLYQDLINPFTDFLLKIKFFSSPQKTIKFPTLLFREPDVN